MSDRERVHRAIDTVVDALGLRILLGPGVKVAHGYAARLPDHQLADVVKRIREALA